MPPRHNGYIKTAGNTDGTRYPNPIMTPEEFQNLERLIRAAFITVAIYLWCEFVLIPSLVHP